MRKRERLPDITHLRRFGPVDLQVLPREIVGTEPALQTASTIEKQVYGLTHFCESGVRTRQDG